MMVLVRKKIRKEKKRWGVVTSRRRALDAALVLDYLITHDAHFCAIATPCPRAPTPCNPFVSRSTMTCTPAQPHLLVAAHNFCRVEITKTVMDAADINKTLFVQRTTGERIHGTAIAAIALHAAGPAASYFANIVPSMLPLPCLACHVATHHAVPCCAGRAPSFCAWYKTPREPSARLARPTAIHRSPWLPFSFPLSSCWLRSFYFQLSVVCLLSHAHHTPCTSHTPHLPHTYLT